MSAQQRWSWILILFGKEEDGGEDEDEDPTLFAYCVRQQAQWHQVVRAAVLMQQSCSGAIWNISFQLFLQLD